MSSDSDLTDISDGYERENGTGSNKRRRGGPSEYKITNALQTPNTSSYATVWLATLMRDGDIKLNPEYQRDVVWSDSKQTKLIDSLLRNYYIPPVIFSLSTDKSGNQTRICIDGKQRLTSISRFIDGMIPHRDGGASYYFKQAEPTKNVRLLPENLRKQFRNKQVICIEYRELSAAAERDIFQRVQLGMALTTGEQFQSYDGPLAKFIHRMHAKLFDEGQIDKLIALATDRGKGFQNLVRTVALISRLPGYTHPSQVQQAKLLQCQGMSEEQVTTLQRKSERAFGILQEIASDTALREIAFPLPNRTTKTSPVEFCFATLLIAMHMDEPDTKARQMAEQIRQMNTEMRAMHSDMRSNSKVSLSFWEYLNNPQKRTSQAAVPAAPASVPVPVPASAAPSPSVPAASLSPKAKRIRVHPPATPGKSWQALLTQPSTSPGKSPNKSKAAATPRSDSAAQFHNIFGSSRQQPQQPSQPETSNDTDL